MDELLEKYVSGQIEEPDFRAELDKLSPEDRTTLEEKARKQKPDVFAELKGLRAEKKRVQDSTPPPPPPPKDTPPPPKGDAGEQFRREQLEKAKTKFWSDFTIPEADRPIIEETFGKLDSGKIDAELIYGDLKRAYAAAQPDKMVDAARKLAEFEKNAAEFNNQAAGANGSGGGGGNDKKYHPLAYDLVENARKAGDKLSLDAAERYLQKGLTRTF